MKHNKPSPIRNCTLILAVGAVLAYGLHRASANASAIAVLKCSVALAFIALSQIEETYGKDLDYVESV